MKKTCTLRYLSGILASLLLALSLAACGTTLQTPGDDTLSPESTSLSDTLPGETTVDPRERDDLPTDVKFDGYEYVVMSDNSKSVTWIVQDIYAEGETGERINDATFARNRKMEERFGVKVKAYLPSGKPWVEAEQLILAQDEAFAALTTTYYEQFHFALKGYLLDMASLKYIDFDKVWWDSTAVDSLSIAGKVYFASGSSHIIAMKATWSTLFNKDLVADVPSIPDLYQLVRDNKWTLDALKTYSQAIAKDVNGDGVMEWGKDIFGTGLQDEVILPLLAGTGEKIIDMKADGTFTYQLNSSEVVTAVEKIWSFMSTDNAHIINANRHSEISDLWNSFRGLFKSNQMGFYMAILGGISDIAPTMDAPFGILPMPKLTEEQDGYYSSIQYNNTHGMSLPRIASNPDRSSMLTEAFQMLAHDTILPAYYEFTLSRRSTTDTDSAEMLDIIFARRNLDIGYSFNSKTGFQKTLQNVAAAETFTFASVEASGRDAFKSTIESCIKEILAHENGK